MGRILAIDYGKKRSGIAVTDPLQIIVTPLETVLTVELFSYLKKYIANEDVEKIVLGYPLDLDGNPTDSTKAVEKAYKKLSYNHSDIPICYEDESFTSKMASRALVEGGFKKKKRQEKGALDKLSAVFILKAHLNME